MTSIADTLKAKLELQREAEKARQKEHQEKMEMEKKKVEAQRQNLLVNMAILEELKGLNKKLGKGKERTGHRSTKAWRRSMSSTRRGFRRMR